MTDALAALDIVRRTRRSLVAVVDALPDTARTVVPDGFRNHVLWNAGHIAATAEALVYGLSGQPTNISDAFMQAFRKGSSPADWDRPWDWDEVRTTLLTLPDTMEADLQSDRFDTYREYTTTPGVVLASVDDAMRFNVYHEGLHLGTILALRKLVR